MVALILGSLVSRSVTKTELVSGISLIAFGVSVDKGSVVKIVVGSNDEIVAIGKLGSPGVDGLAAASAVVLVELMVTLVISVGAVPISDAEISEFY